MTVFPMPSMGADMEQGTLVEWLVQPGDRVARGDAVDVVETQKGAIEIESLTAGKVAELLARPGQTLPVGAPLARIETAAGGPSPGVTAATPPPPPSPTPLAPQPVAAVPPGAGGPVPASPAARRRAAG